MGGKHCTDAQMNPWRGNKQARPTCAPAYERWCVAKEERRAEAGRLV